MHDISRKRKTALITGVTGQGGSYLAELQLAKGYQLHGIKRRASLFNTLRRGDSEIVVWGTGRPRREFLLADDCADALVFLLKTFSDLEHVNVGSGEDVTILELAELVCDVVGFEGCIVHDLTKPDGTLRKLMSADKLRSMGWRPRIGLREGIAATYSAFLAGEYSERQRRRAG